MAEQNEAANTSSDLKEDDAKSIKKYDREVLLMLRESPLALTRPDLPYDRGFVVGEHSWVGARKTLLVTSANCLTEDPIGYVRGLRPLLSLPRANPAGPVPQPRCESHVVTPSPSSKLGVNAATAKDKAPKSFSVDTKIALHASRIPSEETSESSNCAKTIVDNNSTMAAQTDKMKATSQDLIALVQSILKNLRSGNADTLATETRELPIANVVDLQQVLDMIFRRAVEDPGLSQACATMCKALTGMQVPVERETCEVQEFVNIRTLLVNRCQAEFGKYKAFWLSRELMFGEISGMQDDKQKADILSAYMIIEKKVQTTFFRIIGFYGVLFNVRLLTTSLMHLCICHLLLSDVDGSMECLCQLLTTIGKTLESKSGVLGNANDLTEYFTRMAAVLQQSDGVSPALRRTVQDLIDLRKRNWVPREDSANSQSGVQFHERSEEAQTKASNAKGIELGSSLRLNEPSYTSVSGHDSRMDSTTADVQIKSSQDGCDLASTSSKDVPACAEKVGGACTNADVQMKSSQDGCDLASTSSKDLPACAEKVGGACTNADVQLKSSQDGCDLASTSSKDLPASAEKVGGACIDSSVAGSSSSEVPQKRIHVREVELGLGAPHVPTHVETVAEGTSHSGPVHKNVDTPVKGSLQTCYVGLPNQSRPAGSQPFYQNQRGPTPRMVGHRGPMVNMPSNHVGQQMFSQPVQMQSVPQMYVSQVVPAQLQQQMLVPQQHIPMFQNQPRHQNHTNAAYYTQPGHQQILMTQHSLYATAGYPQQHAPTQPFYHQTTNPVGMQRPEAGVPGGPGPQMTRPQPQQVVQGGPPTRQMGQPPVPVAMVSGGPPVVVGSRPSGPQGPPSLSRASSGQRRKYDVDIIDPKTMKSIRSKVYVEDSRLPGTPPGSQDSSARQTPQPQSVTDANAADVMADLAACVLVSREGSAAPARQQFSEVATPSPRPQSDFKTIIEELLSTATAGSVPGLLSKIQAVPINSNEMMKQAFNLVFAKAEVCSSAQETLAEMLCVMSQLPPPKVAVAGHQTISFRLQLQLLIVNRCLEWFEKNTKRELARDAKLKKINVNSDPVLKNKLYALCMEEERRIRLEFVGFVEFAVSLYHRQLLSAKMMHRCVRHLLSSGDSVSLLCLCRLLRSIGEDLDKATLPGTLHATHIELSEYLNRLKAIASEKSESSDLRAEILDVLQLRRNKWLPTLNPAQ